MNADPPSTDQNTREQDPGIRVRRMSVGIVAACLTLLVSAWAVEKPCEPVRGWLWVTGISFLALALIFSFCAALVSEFSRGLERSDGPSEEIHFAIIRNAILGIGIGFLTLIASFSYIAALVGIGAIVWSFLYVQAFISGMLSEHASPPYGQDDPKNFQCQQPYVIITKCRANPGGALWREWIEIQNFWRYSTSLDRLRLVVKFRDQERIYWEGSEKTTLNRFGKLRIYTGPLPEKLDWESRGFGKFLRGSTEHSKFQLSLDRFLTGDDDPKFFEEIILRLEVKTAEGFKRIDEVNVPPGNGPGKILKRGFLCALGQSNHFDNAYRRK